MAQYKSARFGKFTTPTPAVVGPGSYDTYEPSKPPRDLELAYPFLSGAERKTLPISTDAGNFPGPGRYDPVEAKRHVPERILGGVSIDFTDIRLKPKKYEGPGPEAYNLPDNLFSIIKPKLRVHPGTWRGSPGKLWLGSPPRSIIPNAVSIPSRQDENAYDIKEGVLVKNPPNEYLSADFYDVPREDCNFTTMRYKGNFWSLMSGRDEKKTDQTPGPCTYEVDRPTDPTKIRDEEFRSIKRATSKQLRYLDGLWRRKILENHPAPNSYTLPKGPFDKDSTCYCDKHVVKPRGFGCSAKRFTGRSIENLPGPGSYNLDEKPTIPIVKLFAPFGTAASRFKPSNGNPIPGPGSYDLDKDDLAKRIFSICRRSYARPRVPLRCKSSSGSIRHEDAGGDYSFTPDPWANKSRVYHAVFKSTTARFKDATPRERIPPATVDASREIMQIETRACSGPFFILE